MKKKKRISQQCTNIENLSWIYNLCIYSIFNLKIIIIHDIMHLKNDSKKKPW